MGKKGRPKKAGKREPNGRVQRPSKAETEWQTMEPALRRRCVEMELDVTYENMRKVRGQEGGTPWGRLHLTSQISYRQMRAIGEYWMARERYLYAIDAPKENPKAASMDPDQRGASLHQQDPNAAKQARATFSALDKALHDAGRLARRAVYETIAGERAALEHLLWGAEAIAGHLKIPEYEEKAA